MGRTRALSRILDAEFCDDSASQKEENTGREKERERERERESRPRVVSRRENAIKVTGGIEGFYTDSRDIALVLESFEGDVRCSWI